MASLAGEGKEVAVTYKGFKRLRKGTKGSSSSAAKEGGLDPRSWRSMVLSGLMPKWKQRMLQKIGLMRVALNLSSLPSVVLSVSWGGEFAELKECNLTLEGNKRVKFIGRQRRRFGAKAVEEHGLKWFNAQMEAKDAPENWNDEGLFALEFPTIRGTVRELGSFNAFLGTPVVDPMMYLIFLEKPPHRDIRTPVVDLVMYSLFLEKPPYRNIHHMLYGEHSAAPLGKGP
ncbi:hypothetical protein HAX54_000601 [Datura stramonium]|uniref:Uncharacterized protein n=1 Tax=Datura stramonium TaxID=4076 RepID=A0ABS8WQ59_DATST|nr:hypothetical protein [Datura stramonium]